MRYQLGRDFWKPLGPAFGDNGSWCYRRRSVGSQPKRIRAQRTESVFARQFELLKLEMTLIDSAIRAQDDITKSIKNWAIVTWTASIGFAVAQAPLKRFVWVTVFVPIAFWLVDTAFRRVQRSFIV